ncbi:MAG: hypothetical protein K2R98_30025 [Gemmataceae bacterium]|nr:hypothetical protein [Gemmataceae bacterium]
MRHLCLTAVLLLLSTTAAQAKLEIENIQSTYGPLLPERKELEFFPNDLIFFRYLVTGAKVDERGQVDAEAVVKFLDEKGKELNKSTIPFKGPLSLGGNSFAGAAYVVLNDQYLNGTYTVNVTVTDNLASEKATFTREVRIRPVDFAIVHPRFSYDADGKAQAPIGGLVNQTLYFRLGIVGFNRGQDRVDILSSVQILDEKGKELLPKPLETNIKSEDPKVVKATNVATFNGSLHLHRAGDFTLRVTVTDRLGQKTTKIEFPLRVTAP